MLCSNAHSVLVANGILFPLYSDWSQHSFLAWMSQKRDLFNIKHFIHSIYDEAKLKKCNTTLLSGEAFENFLVDTHLANEFEELAKQEGYTDIEWLVIHRDPIDYLKSVYAEMSGYKVVLDLKLMANLILDYGYISPSSKDYNNIFVFDVLKFSEIFKESVNSNLTVLKFEDFIADFVGKIFFKMIVDKKSLKSLSSLAISSEKLRKRFSPEKVEFRYVANFLGMEPTKKFHENNKNLVDSLITHRMNRNISLLSEIDAKFKERFG
jgi:hypothetical protein